MRHQQKVFLVVVSVGAEDLEVMGDAKMRWLWRRAELGREEF